MSAQHTPGPWIIKDRDWLQSEHGPIVDGRYFSICVSATSEADRALILAAPELLEALCLYRAACGNTAASADRKLVQMAWAKAVDAIAKATGAAS